MLIETLTSQLPGQRRKGDTLSWELLQGHTAEETALQPLHLSLLRQSTYLGLITYEVSGRDKALIVPKGNPFRLGNMAATLDKLRRARMAAPLTLTKDQMQWSARLGTD